MKIKDNLIIITGARRSGTTFLLDLLDGHPDLVVFPTDLRILYAYFPYFINLKISKKKKILRLKKIIFDELNKELKKRGIKSDFNIIKWEKIFFKKLNEKKLDDIGHILQTFINSFKQSMNERNKTIVLKETNLEINYFLLKKIFKNFKILRIQRDPRGAIGSVKSGFDSHYSKMGDEFNVSMFSDILREMIKFKILNKIQNEKNLLTIKFENLIKKNNREINNICKFLKIKKTKSLFIQSKFSKEYRYKNFLNKKVEKFDKKRIFAWKKILSTDEKIIIEIFLKDILKKYKYKPSTTKPNISLLSDFYNKINPVLFYKNRF